jgi:hypothetical protein
MPRKLRVPSVDWTAFVTGKLYSLCEPCHKSAKPQIELFYVPTPRRELT